jgi:hypothetical protein
LTGKSLVWYEKEAPPRGHNSSKNKTRRLFWIKIILISLSLAKKLPRPEILGYIKRLLRWGFIF